MYNRENVKPLIDEYLKACKSKNITFTKVILFGSVANNTNHEFSDIDLALVSEQFTGNPFEDWHKLSPIGIHFSDIEPHPFSVKHFNESDPFVEEIKKTGIEIHFN